MMSRYTSLCAFLLLLITLTVMFLFYADGFGGDVARFKFGLSSASGSAQDVLKSETNNKPFPSELEDVPRTRMPHNFKSRLAHYRAPVIPLNDGTTVSSSQKFVLKRGTEFEGSSVDSEMRCPQPIRPNMILPCDSTSDPICRQYLLPADYSLLRNTTEQFQNLPYGKCRFMNGSQRAPVALASFPGSGNTWVRGLLEQATGICTGSLYHDSSLRASGMNGEVIRSGTVLVVKTHHRHQQIWTEKPTIEFSRKSVPKWACAIFIVRNLSQALISDWNRHRHNPKYYPEDMNTTENHLRYVRPEAFGNSLAWSKFLKRRAVAWPDYFTSWYFSGYPVLVVRYEDLKSDALTQVKRMLDFLGFPYTENELQKRMAEDYSMFHRSSHQDFEHFTPRQKMFVRGIVRKTVGLLRENGGGNTLGIEEYL